LLLGAQDFAGADEDYQAAYYLHEIIGKMDTPMHAILLQRRSRHARCLGNMDDCLGMLQEAWHIRTLTGTLDTPEAVDVYDGLMQPDLKMAAAGTEVIAKMQMKLLMTYQKTMNSTLEGALAMPIPDDVLKIGG